MKYKKIITTLLAVGITVVNCWSPAIAIEQENSILSNSHTLEALSLTYSDLGTDENSVISISIDKFTDTTATTFSFPTEISGCPVKVIKIADSAFSACRSLQEIIIPDTVTELGSCCFQYCYDLQSVTIPDSITVIPNRAFSNCSALTEVTLPDTITEIGSNAFYDTAIVEAQAENPVQYVGNWAVQSKNNLTTEEQELHIAEDTIGLANNILESSKLTSITMPNSLKYIGSYAFANSNLISDITIPEQVITIGEAAFYNTDIAHVTAKGAIHSIGNQAFQSCQQLQTVTLTNGTKQIGESAFSGCDYLQSVQLPDELEFIGKQAFLNCPKLDNITIPNGVTNLPSKLFSGCTSLQTISIADSVSSVAADAFSDTALINSTEPVRYADRWVIDANSNLTEVTIKEGTIGIADNVFSETLEIYHKLTSVYLPDSLQYIGNSAFNNCQNLENIILPNNLKIIECSAFYNCWHLKNLILPQTVSEIGTDALRTSGNAVTILNPAMIIPDEEFTISVDTIYGYSNSTAQSYAEKYNINFVALDAPSIGDPTGDNIISVEDAVLTLTIYAQKSAGLEVEFSEAQLTAADVNGDDIIGVEDAVAILTYYARQSAGLQPTWAEIIG